MNIKTLKFITEKDMRNKIGVVLKIILVSVLLTLFIIFPEQMANSVSDSIEVCLNVIIPSMFVFMVLSSYIIDEGIYKTLISPLYFLLKGILPLNKELFSVFILSLIGGYPTGIKLLRERIAENKNYHEIYERIAGVCYCVSPVFAINIIGYGIYGSGEAGTVVYISNALSCFILAIFTAHRIRRITADKDDEMLPKYSPKGLIFSINSASKALIMICAVIICFNSVLTVTEHLLTILNIEPPEIIAGFFEISNLTKIKSPSPLLLPVFSFISSFGGVCVLAQTIALAGKDFSLKYFFIGRLICGVLSAFLTYIIMNIWEISVSSSAGLSGYTYIFNQNKLVVLLLIVMCTIIFIKSEKIFKKV